MRRCVAALGFGLLMSLAGPARAEEPWQTDPESVAKELFFRGVKLLEAGDAERALDAFLRSRATIPRRGNTLNAALCLEKLGRADEALELYEDVIARFASDLPAPEKAALTATMSELRGKLGAVVVNANITGASVQIDGRPRGTLPLSSSIRVSAGSHTLRVVKNGYETLVQTIVVEARQTQQIDVKIAPLTNAGELRIESEDGQVAEVFVDGALVGSAPWEGLLPPGRHAVWIRRGEAGSAPASLVVVAGQVSLARLPLFELGPQVTVSVEPRTAELSIDGVSVGAGSVALRLPRGKHRVVASEPGYISRSATLELGELTQPQVLEWSLSIDAAHPRWPRPEPGHFWLGAAAAYAGAGRLGSGAEASCTEDCVSDPPASGALIAGRIGYRFPAGVSLELGGGWLGLTKDVYRVERDSFAAGGARHAVRYDVLDQVSLSGPVLLFGGSYMTHLGWRIDLVSRLSGGVLFARASDDVTAVARTDGAYVSAVVYGQPREVSAIVPAIAPELGLELALGDARVGLGLAAMFLPVLGGSYVGTRIGVTPRPDPDDPGSVGNAPQSDVIDGERSFGGTAIFLPGLSFRYEL